MSEQGFFAVHRTVACRGLDLSSTDRSLPMTLYGYARVSTTDQDLSLQETALRTAGCQVGVKCRRGQDRILRRFGDAAS